MAWYGYDGTVSTRRAIPWGCAVVLALSACGTVAQTDDAGDPTEGSSSTTMQEPSASESSGAVDESSSGEPVDPEVLACYGVRVMASIGIHDGYHVERWGYWCTQQARQLLQLGDGQIKTEIVLACEKEDPETQEAVQQEINLVFRNVAVDLGPEPMVMNRYYDLTPLHTTGSEAEDYFELFRDDELIVYGAGNQPRSLEPVGGTEILGEVMCSLDTDCGLAMGIEGIGPDGEPVRELSGEPVELVVGDRTMLVAVWGLDPKERCSDGGEPDDRHPRRWVTGIDTRYVLLP